MPSSLRAQVALWGMLACLLIPIGVSNLRGLTHILTCEEQATSTFTIEVDESGRPVSAGSTSFERSESGDSRELCGGLLLNMELDDSVPGTARMVFAITNNTEYGWRGSVQVDLGSTPIPIDIGEIPAGETEQDSVDIELDAGSTYEIDGSLLIGP
jgi:hypothetical protein